MSQNAIIAATQFEPTIGAVDSNLETMETEIERHDTDVDIVVFPELTLTGYDLPAARATAAPIPGPLTDPLVEMAEAHDVAIVVGLPERDGESLYNVLIYVDERGVRGKYRKQYLWGNERDVFDGGDGPETIDTEFGTVGFLVCYDLNLPESSLAYARQETDLLLVSAAWRPSFTHDWRLLNRSRALDGTCYVVGSNHVGSQAGREHAGHSLVAGPGGRILTEAGADRETIVHELDYERLRDAREKNPVFETRSLVE